MIANCIENTNLEEMNQSELSSFISEFKEYMESEKRVKEIMQYKIRELKADNESLHIKLGNKIDSEIETDNSKSGYKEEQFEELERGYTEEYAKSCYC